MPELKDYIGYLLAVTSILSGGVFGLLAYYFTKRASRNKDVEDLLNSIIDYAIDYWTSNGSPEELAAIATKLSVRIDDLEDKLTEHNVRAITELAKIRDLATGGTFQTRNKDVLSHNDQLFKKLKKERKSILIKYNGFFQSR